MTAHKPPRPAPGSRQKYGETMAQFADRMRDAKKRYLQNETAKARQRRLDMEKRQANHPLPGSNSHAPTVWHWEEDPDTGFMMRMPVTRLEIRDTGFWEMYSNEQRRYNSINNEWDVCTLFEDGATMPNGEVDDEDDNEVNMNRPAPPTLPAPQPFQPRQPRQPLCSGYRRTQLPYLQRLFPCLPYLRGTSFYHRDRLCHLQGAFPRWSLLPCLPYLRGTPFCQCDRLCCLQEVRPC